MIDDNFNDDIFNIDDLVKPNTKKDKKKRTKFGDKRKESIIKKKRVERKQNKYKNYDYE